jgi:hypothetical protein
MKKERTHIMRMLAKTMVAIGFAGAAAVAVPSAVSAQGIYLGVPGVGIEIGRPYYRDRYYRYDYDGPYAYSGPSYYYGARPYSYERRYYRRGWEWD